MNTQNATLWPMVSETGVSELGVAEQDIFPPSTPLSPPSQSFFFSLLFFILFHFSDPLPYFGQLLAR